MVVVALAVAGSATRRAGLYARKRSGVKLPGRGAFIGFMILGYA